MRVTADQIKNLIKNSENKIVRAPKDCTELQGFREEVTAAQAYAEIINGTASLEIEEVVFEGEVLKILYKQGVARVDLTCWPDYPKQLMLDICKPFESLL